MAPLIAAMAFLGSACSSEPATALLEPYVEIGSQEDIWDYTGYGVRFKIRVVEHTNGLLVPGGNGATTEETLEILASEYPGEHSNPEFGAAVGSTVLVRAPAMYGATWRRVFYSLSELADGEPVRYGFYGGPDDPALHDVSENDTGLTLQKSAVIRYRR